MTRVWPSMCVAVSLLACEPAAPEGVASVDGFGSEGDAGSAGEPLAFAVVSTDRTVTSVALLDPRGGLLARDFIHSGSVPAGLVTALSGDVVLPTRSGDPGILTLIDRFRTDVITRVDPAGGVVLGQIRTHGSAASGEAAASYSSNPHDYVYFGPHQAWVSRFEPNLAVDAGDPDGGNDLLRIDPTDLSRSARIDMGFLDQRAARENPDTGEMQTVDVYARPSGMVRLGDRLVVGLAGLSRSFDAVGQGRVALVDPALGDASGFELPGLQNCSSVQPVPGDDQRVVVACSGFYRGVLRETAGIALLSLRDDALSIEHVWRAADDPSVPLSVAAVVPIGGSLVVAMAPGEPATPADGDTPAHPETTDVVYVLDLATGEQTPLFSAAGRYRIGSGAYNAPRGLLLLPDASVDDAGRPIGGVRLFTRGPDGAFEPEGVVEIDAILPPWQVAAL